MRALTAALALLLPSVAAAVPAAVFVAADPAHQLAAQELQRYLHLSSSSGLAACALRAGAKGAGAGVGGGAGAGAGAGTGAGASAVHGVVLLTAETWRERLPVLLWQPDDGLAPASVARLGALGHRLGRGTDEHALLAISTASGRRVIAVLGATDRSVLMGAYSLIERLTSVRFQLHGDILPDRTGGSLPALGDLFAAGHAALGETGVMLSPGDVSVRGLQPFHDFAEGPDWWNAAEYKLLLDQMAKMKLNMIALHNYGQSLVEATVWTGLETDFNRTTGRLGKNGSYGSGYITTSGGATVRSTPSTLRRCCCSSSHTPRCERAPSNCELARRCCCSPQWGGVPMNISDYLFGAQNAFASDCYGSDVMRRAGGCPDLMLSPATPPKDQRVNPFDGAADMLTDAFSWGRALGIESTVGIEACGVCCSNPAADADPPQYPGDRTAALKDYYSGTLLHINATYQSEYFWIWTSEAWGPRTNASTPMSDLAVQGMVENFQALHEAKEETGLPTKLATGGWTLGPLADLAYFDNVLPEGFVMTSINEKIGMQNVEAAYGNVTKHQGWSIPWMEDDSAMNGVQLWANRTLVFVKDAVEIGGATGLLGIHWRVQDIAPQASALAQWAWNRTLTSAQLYQDLLAAEFGLVAGSPLAKQIAAIFETVDSFGSLEDGSLAPPKPGVKVQTPGWPGFDPTADYGRAFLAATKVAIPRPIVWGPGRLDNTFEITPATFRFVEEFEALRPAVAAASKSAPLPLARFDRWLASFHYLRAAGEVGDTWRRIAEATGSAVGAIRRGNEIGFRAVWSSSLLPLRAELINRTQLMVNSLTATVTDTGSLGALANLQQYTLPMVVETTDLAYKALHGSRCKPTGPVKCYAENTSAGRIFPFTPGRAAEYSPGSCSDSLTDERCAKVARMSHEWCAMMCHAANASYTHAAVESYDQCRCAIGISAGITTRPDSECDAPCYGEAGALCGGDWRAAGFAFTCASNVPVPPAPLPAEFQWESHRNASFTGGERLVVMTPRGRLGADEKRMPIQVIALAASAYVAPPAVMVRPMGSTAAFRSMLMRRAAPTRQVFTAELEVSGSLEYYVQATTKASGRLLWPAGGAANAHTVLVVAPAEMPSLKTDDATTCNTLGDPCHIGGTPANVSSCCVCTPWPHCSPGTGENFVCNGSVANSRCVAGPPPPPWGTPCPAPPPSLAPTSSNGRANGKKTVRLWIGNPFGWPKGGPANQVEFCMILAELEKLRDVIDEITLTGFYVAEPGLNTSTGGLLRSEGTLEVLRALRTAGWTKIHMMIGGIPANYGGTNGSIAVYRYYTRSPAFVKAVVHEVKQQGFQGINLDFEPSDCLKHPTVPCGPNDCEAMGTMLSHIKAGLKPEIMVSVDTGQSGLASTGCLNTSSADRFISMNSYYDRESFDVSLPRDIAAVGVGRYGMGVCPTCSAPLCKAPKCSNLTDVLERMDEATKSGVLHVDFWASAKQPDWAFGPEWWAAIRKWKAAV